MQLVCDTVLKLPNQSRLPDPRLTRDQYDLAFTRLRSLPPAEQYLHFLVSADQLRQALGPRGVEPPADW